MRSLYLLLLLPVPRGPGLFLLTGRLYGLLLRSGVFDLAIFPVRVSFVCIKSVAVLMKRFGQQRRGLTPSNATTTRDLCLQTSPVAVLTRLQMPLRLMD